jgi:hypothetical protein
VTLALFNERFFVQASSGIFHQLLELVPLVRKPDGTTFVVT